MKILKFKKKKEQEAMNVEIVPITVQRDCYNQQTANLIEQLLLIDEKLFPSDKLKPNPKEAA